MMKNGMMMLLFVPFGAFLILPVSHGQGTKKPKFTLSKKEKLLVDLTNKARKERNLPPLRPNAKLFRAARAHSQNMAKQQKLAHVLDGKKSSQRIRAAGYIHRASGENVGLANNEEQVFGGWMKSKLHRKNMLNGIYTDIGIGRAVDTRGAVWYTQVFAVPFRRR